MYGVPVSLQVVLVRHRPLLDKFYVSIVQIALAPVIPFIQEWSMSHGPRDGLVPLVLARSMRVSRNFNSQEITLCIWNWRIRILYQGIELLYALL